MTHDVIHEYMAKEGLVVAGVCREVYLNDPNETHAEELHRGTGASDSDSVVRGILFPLFLFL